MIDLIFGESNNEKEAEWNREKKRLYDGGFYTAFAFFPKRLNSGTSNGKYVWLQRYKFKPYVYPNSYGGYASDRHIIDIWIDK